MGDFPWKLVGCSIVAHVSVILTFCRDRSDPSGYKVSIIQFANGEPVAPANSNTSYTDIFANADNSACPDNCFRPVSMAFDRQGRMFVSCDYSGEIYVIVRDEASNATSGGSGSTEGGPSDTGSKTSGANLLDLSNAVLGLIVLAVYLVI